MPSRGLLVWLSDVVGMSAMQVAPCRSERYKMSGHPCKHNDICTCGGRAYQIFLSSQAVRLSFRPQESAKKDKVKEGGKAGKKSKKEKKKGLRLRMYRVT